MVNINKLKDFIKKNRITSGELLTDIQDYLEKEYEQRGKTFRRSSPFGMILNVLVGLVNLVFFYLEDVITESNRYTARRPNTIRGFSSLVGHQPHTRSAASGTLDFSFSLGGGEDIEGGKLTISNRTVLTNQDNGLKYTLMLPEDRITLNVNSVDQASFKAHVLQGEFATSTFTANGDKMQSYMIGDSAIDINHIEIFVNGKNWDVAKSMYDLRSDQEACLVKTNFQGGIDVVFGNGSFGKIPNAGAAIRVDYLKTNGMIGDIKESSNWDFETPGTDIIGNEVDLNDKYNVTVEEPIIFGSNEESIDFTRLIAPNKSMTFSLINANDYTSFLKRFEYFSTVKTFVERRNNMDSNLIEILLIPNLRKRLATGDTYFSLQESNFLLNPHEKNKIQRFLTLSGNQAPNIDVQIIDPIIRRYSIDIIVRAFEGEEEYIIDKIKDMTSKYFLATNRKDYIPSSDLVYLFEKIDGLDSVNVFFISEKNEADHLERGTTETTGRRIIGLDRMNDIAIHKNELPIIRGGWEDRFGQQYSKSDIRSFVYKDILDADEPIEKGAINVFFQESIPRNINTDLLEKEIRNIE